ncbi:F-box family protein isoform 1 [Dorcoceras hygrometricum]|uniref:F-box family protein isoform 1 n=1 Tax=Dorcoceras hygrometricum TaxID=472368 RepID=A0A2Z7CUH5_9LAMI|nr:F-box family protein isoform 1 [Dorcoceras hygrometricum]
MKRRRARDSADGLALMTSSVTSSYSADDLREQSQESADSADALCVEIQQSQDTSWKHMFNTNWTTRRKQQQHPVVSSIEPPVAIYPVTSFSVIVYPVDLSTKISAEDEFSGSDKSAAKQLTIYESWMSTAELNSNGENDKKPAKEKDARNQGFTAGLGFNPAGGATGGG